MRPGYLLLGALFLLGGVIVLPYSPIFGVIILLFGLILGAGGIFAPGRGGDQYAGTSAEEEDQMMTEEEILFIYDDEEY